MRKKRKSTRKIKSKKIYYKFKGRKRKVSKKAYDKKVDFWTAHYSKK